MRRRLLRAQHRHRRTKQAMCHSLASWRRNGIRNCREIKPQLQRQRRPRPPQLYLLVTPTRSSTRSVRGCVCDRQVVPLSSLLLLLDGGSGGGLEFRSGLACGFSCRCFRCFMIDLIRALCRFCGCARCRVRLYALQALLGPQCGHLSNKQQHELAIA